MPTRAEREQEEREREQAEKQERERRGHATQQPNRPDQQHPNDPNNPDAAERERLRKATDERAKQQKAYIEEMNRKIGEVVDNAASAKDKDPQLMSFTVEALKNAAQQLEGALPNTVR
jgi:hypothetical protein